MVYKNAWRALNVFAISGRTSLSDKNHKKAFTFFDDLDYLCQLASKGDDAGFRAYFAGMVGRFPDLQQGLDILDEIDAGGPSGLELAGEDPVESVFDRELVSTFRRIPAGYWASHPDQKVLVQNIVERATANVDIGNCNLEDGASIFDDAAKAASVSVSIANLNDGGYLTVRLSVLETGASVSSHFAADNSFVQIADGTMLQSKDLADALMLGARTALHAADRYEYSVSVSIDEVFGRLGSANLAPCYAATRFGIVQAVTNDSELDASSTARLPKGWVLVECTLSNPLISRPRALENN